MSFERPIGPGAEPPPVPAGRREASADGDALTPAMRLQILSTEHWSLLASRSLAWNESFSRAGMFLSTLAGAIVALALVAQADNFGEGFRVFALVILPVVLLVGTGTVLRMGFSNYHDAICVVGMNRIRAAYMEMAPDLKHYFVMGTTDDDLGVSLTMAVQPGTSLLVQMLASTPMLVTVLNGVLVAAIVGIVMIQFGAPTGLAIGLGGLAFVLTIGAFTWYAGRDIARVTAAYTPLFPGAPDEERPVP